MRLLFILIILTAFFSCNRDKIIDTPIPTCIQEIIDNPERSADLKTIKVQKSGNQLHYWLNTDATTFDGSELIVNNSCDTICHFCGECTPPKCTKRYNHNNWETIWVQ